MRKYKVLASGSPGLDDARLRQREVATGRRDADRLHVGDRNGKLQTQLDRPAPRRWNGSGRSWHGGKRGPAPPAAD